MPRHFTRRSLLGTAAVAAVAGGLPSAARSAPPEADLAWIRLLIAAELLAVDFYTEFMSRLPASARSDARRILADEKVHYRALAQLISAFGGVPATRADIEFTYPSVRAPEIAFRIERLLTGAYVGAAVAIQDESLRLPIAQIAVNETQHAAVWSRMEGHGVVGSAFGPALSLAEAAGVLGLYEE